MKICHVCSAHTADDGRVFHRACATLAAVGYEVHLIATSSATSVYKRQGVVIHPLPKVSSRAERFAHCAIVARMARDLQPDLYHVHEPELLGSVLTRAGSRPVVWDVHESFLNILMYRDWLPLWMRPLVRGHWDWMESRLVRKCAAVIAATEGIAPRYRTLHDKVRVIHNFPDLATIDELPPIDREPMTCVFAGALLQNRGLEKALAGLAILRKRGLDVHLKLAGKPSPENYLHSLLLEAERLDIDDLVSYHGTLPLAKAWNFQRRGSIALHTCLPIGNNLVGLPAKILECMAFGLPCIISDIPIQRDLIVKCGAGIAVDPTQPQQIADAIEKLIRDPNLARQMGEAGKRAIGERYNWGLESAELLELYREILGEKPRFNTTPKKETNLI